MSDVVMHANNMLEPAFPNDNEMVEVLELVGDLRESAAKLSADAGEGARSALSKLLRAMNSYYSNKIEGQHTLPVDLEAAMARKFSENEDIRRRQELAIAHIKVEEELEPVARQMGWGELFQLDWICRIHHDLYVQLPDDFRRVIDQDGNDRGELVPGELRAHDVVVHKHLAPPFGSVPALLRHFHFRYGPDFPMSRKIVAAGASHHRLAWIHPFADGNGRASRLHNHLLLHHLGLTNGLWSPMRGLARKQNDYYQALAAADDRRRNDTDGRGNLSSIGLTTWLKYWVGVCQDQVTFMAQLLSLEKLEQRYIMLAVLFIHGFGAGKPHHNSQLSGEMLGQALYQLFRTGSVDRGAFKQSLGLPDRSATRLIAQLTAAKLIESGSKSGRLQPSFPFYSIRFLFPGLWPEAERIEPPEPAENQNVG